MRSLVAPRLRIPDLKPPTYLRGNWRFFEGSGTQLGDHSRYRNHGTINTAAAWAVDATRGKCLRVGAKTDYVNLGDVPSLDLVRDMSIEMWLKVPSGMADKELIGKQLYNTCGWLFTVIDERHLQLRTLYAGGYAHTWAWGGLTANIWHHTVGVLSSATGTIYVDGVDDTNASGDHSARVSPIGTAALLGHTANDRANCYVQGVRIYSIALTASEVLTRYNATK